MSRQLSPVTVMRACTTTTVLQCCFKLADSCQCCCTTIALPPFTVYCHHSIAVAQLHFLWWLLPLPLDVAVAMTMTTALPPPTQLSCWVAIAPNSCCHWHFTAILFLQFTCALPWCIWCCCGGCWLLLFACFLQFPTMTLSSWQSGDSSWQIFQTLLHQRAAHCNLCDFINQVFAWKYLGTK